MIEFNGVETLYYGYTDNQGSLVALTDENGTVVERYAYDPWGARRKPDNWSEKDSRTSWLVNRGYTGHEHLDAFGIINMNGRVYDPLTAQFFSPDPYIQAPGDWLNYNRYAYCMNNPFKYTDPSGNLFYVSPSMGWSASGGLTVSLGAGLGIPGGLSFGATVSYGFKYDNISLTLNASFAGAYAYVGYDTHNGVIGGVGFDITSSIFGTNNNPFSSSSSIYSVGVSFSEHGGFASNFFGFNYSFATGALSFDSSIGASYSFKPKSIPNLWGKYFDLSKGSGATNISEELAMKTIKAFYVGKFEDANVFESKYLGTEKLYLEGGKSGGITFPDINVIVVGKGVLSKNLDIWLLKHEWGHILQYKEIGAAFYYNNVASASIKSGIIHDKNGWSETWANYKSYKYFLSKYGDNMWPINRFPIADLSREQYIKFFGTNLYFINH